MGINWKIVLGKMGETMAEKEDEYRKFATDYFLKRYETQAEEKKAWDEKTREQKREINKKIDALRAEGLTDVQIANGLNTYKENFFAVVADDLNNYKKSDNYKFLMRQDPTGAKFREFYSNRFNNLVETESQQGLKLDPVVQGLLDKFPEMTETPDIAQSIFGFDYTRGIREDIKGLSKDTNVPDYDAPAGLTGVSSLLSGTIRDVPAQQTYTGNMLDKQIVMRLEARFGDLGIAQDGTRFETKADMDAKEIAQVKKAKAAQLEVQRRFNEERLKTPPGTMEGGMSDQELLDKVVADLGYDRGTAGREEIDDTADAGTPTVDFGNNVSSFIDSNPQSPVSKLIAELKGIDGVDDTVLQNILSAIASGKPIRSAIKGLNIPSSVLNRINNYINNLDDEDKATIAGFGSAPSQSSDQGEQDEQEQQRRLGPRGELGDEDIDMDKKIVQARPSNVAEGELWDSIYGKYFNPDGTPAVEITQELYNRLVRQYTVALAKMRNVDQTQDLTA